MVPELGHVLDVLSLKSEALVPVMVMLLMFRAIVVLVSVSVEDFAALVEPTATVPKDKDAGRRVAVAVEPPLPVPERATVCEPVLVLSKTVRVAERAPEAVGLKVIVTKQVASGLIVPEFGQVLEVLSLKSAALVPVMVMLLMFSAIVVLVSVSVDDFAALVEPTATVPKDKDAGRRVAVAVVPPLPVPERATVCEPALVLSKTVRVAERDPEALGLNVTVTRQVASGLIVPEPGQVLDVLSLKSAALVPVMVMLLMFSAMVVLVSVKVEDFAALVEPTATVPKLRVAGSRVAVAVAPVDPVPLSATV
jgi:hypothetical protein